MRIFNFLLASTFTILIGIGSAFSQTTVFFEDFELASSPDSVNYSGNGIHAKSADLHYSGLYSDSLNTTNVNDTIKSTTHAFSTLGYSGIYLYFSHICKTEFFDDAYIEVSTNGTSWTRLTGTNYFGAGNFAISGNKFTASSYINDWKAGYAEKPNNTWWKTEMFDISTFCANSTNVQVRFVLRDGGVTFNGPDDYAWFIDDIKVVASVNELLPPVISWAAPILADTVTSNTPYPVYAKITDNSGIDSAILVFTSNGGLVDTIGMTMIATDTFRAYIPFQGYGRTISYYVRAIDNSGAHNSSISGTKSVYAKYSTLFAFEFTGNNMSDDYHGPIYRNSASSTFDYSRYAFLITQAEMAAKGIPSGYVKEIAWYKTSAIGTLGNALFDIYAKNSNKTEYITGYVTVPWDTAVTGATKIFHSTSYQLPGASGWVNFNVNPFYYTGGAIEFVTDYDVSSYPGQPGGPINWRFSNQFTSGRTLGSSSTSPTAILAAFVYGGAYRTDIRLKVETPYSLQTDAGISLITSPSAGVSANVPFTLEVKIKNFGVDTLALVAVKWSIDGITNGSSVITTSLLQNQVSGIIVLDTITLPVGVHHIKVWTENPNSVMDQNIANDTAYFSTMACSGPLSGTYQIGQAGNFASFSDAITALEQCGVSGPVVFNAATGTYSEQFEVGSITGISATNNITFKSANNDSTSVIIKFSNSGSQNNHVFSLNGAKYLVFEGLGFENSSLVFSRIAELKNGCSNISFRNCNFVGGTLNLSGENQSIIFADSLSIDSTIIIENNNFQNGYIGISLRGATVSNLAKGIQVNSNIFVNQSVLAMKLKFLNAPIVTENQVYTTKTSIASQGISFTHVKNKWRFNRNTINLLNGSRAFAIWNCNSNNGNEANFNNNMISVGGTVLSSIIDIENGTGIKFYNNSINKYSNTAGSVVYLNTFPSTERTDSLYFYNNIFTNNSANGYLVNLEYAIGTRRILLNYNNYFTSSATFSKNGSSVSSTLNSWKTSVSQESNALNTNPFYVASNNLHITNFGLKGMGISLPEISIDIDGSPRNTNNPTIGAHELVDLTYDIQMIAVLSPESSCAMSNSEVVKIIIRNNGLNAITTPFTLNYRVVGNSQIITDTITQTIVVGDTLEHVFTTNVNLSLGGYGNDSTFNIKVWSKYGNDSFNFNDTITHSVVSGYKPPVPTANLASTNYGTSVAITATSPYTVNWFASDTSSTIISTGNIYLTPVLFDTTIFYAASKWSGPMGCYSDKIPVQVNITNFPARDAGVYSIVSPLSQNSSNDTLELLVKVKNYGLNNLTSAKIAYSIDGVLKDSVAWSGNIARDSVFQISIDEFVLTPGQHVLKTWTFKPNNLADQFLTNDTMTQTLFSCMSGVYTIGPNGSSSSPDYNSFTSAFNALMAGGVCGNVTFMVEDGQYNESMIVNAIPNTGPNSRVVFKSVSGDSTMVKIYKTFTGTETALIKFNNVNYVEFQEIGFKTISSTSNGRVIELVNSKNNKWTNCFIEGNITTSTSNVHAAIFWNSGLSSFNAFENNKVTGGSSGFYLYGPTTGAHSKSNYLIGNTVSGDYFAGILSSYQDSMVITDNVVRDPVSGSSTVYGIYMYKSDFGGDVSRNSIDISSGIAGSGIYLSNCNSTPYDRIRVVNNMVISSSASGTAYGLNLNTSSNVDLFYNSFNMLGASTLSRAIYFNGSSYIDFRNNIAIANNGFVVYFNGINSVNAMDFNNYKTSGAYFGYYNNANVLSFSSFKTLTGRDAHSIYGSAPFVASNDLHLTSVALSAKATPITSVTDDIDGDTRSAYPTIGADEFPLSAIDAAVSQVIMQSSNIAEFDTLRPKIVIINMGINPIYNIPVSYNINGGTSINTVYQDTLDLFESDTIDMAYSISPAGNFSLCAKTQMPNDTVVLNDEICIQLASSPFNDLYLTRIVSLEEGCNLTSDTIKLMIKNEGAGQLSGNITGYYKLNPSQIISQQFNKTINAGDSTLLEFNTLVDLSAPNADTIYEITAWVDFPADNVSSNDSSISFVKSKVSPPVPLANQVTVAYGTQAVLTASSTANTVINWFEGHYTPNIIHTGNSFNMPVVYSNDTVWVESKSIPVADSAYFGNSTTYNTATGWPTPYGGYAWSNKEQYLFLASELSALEQGNIINQISFFVDTVNNCPNLIDYVIKMKHTTTNSMNGWIPGALTTVYSNGLYHPVSGENIHALQTPFVWDGVSNIVVEVCFSNSSYNSNGNVSVFNSVTPFNSVARYNGNYSTICTAPASYTNLAIRPNIKFVFQEEGCPSPRVPVVVNVTGTQSTDLGVSSIITPSTSPILTSSETVQVVIKNFGSSQQFGFPVSFTVDTLIYTDIVSDTIQPGDSLLYTFTNFADLGIDGKLYKLTSFTGASADITNFNDTVYKDVANLLSPYCASGPSSNAYTDISLVEIGNWSNYSAPSGNTYSDFTTAVSRPDFSIGNPYPISITSAHTPGSTTTSQTYVKVWVDLNKDNVLSDATELVYGSYTTPNNTVNGQFTIPIGSTPGYTLMRVVLQYLGGPSSTLPCGYYQFGETEDYIVNIMPQPNCDAGVMEILQPNELNIAGTSQPVWVKFKNFGSDTIQANSLAIQYIYDNAAPVQLVYSQILDPQEVDSIQLSPITVLAGDKTLTASLNLSCDSYLSNNGLSKIVFGNTLETLPYSDDFEGVTNWHSTDYDVWQLGVPQGLNIFSAPSGANVWMTELDANYPNSKTSSLITPEFDFSILASTDTVILSFENALYTELGSDYCKIDFSKDGGTTWAALGYVGDPQATNWYNSAANGVHFWTGNHGWQTATYKLDPSVFNQANPVVFRFMFKSDGSGSYDGWAIDDFSLSLQQVDNDASLIEIIAPVDTTVGGQVYDLKIVVKNEGLLPISSLPISYIVDGQLFTTTIQYTNPLNNLEVDTITINQALVSPLVGYELKAWVGLVNDARHFNDTSTANIFVAINLLDVGVTGVIISDSIYYVDHLGNQIANHAIAVVKNFGLTTVTQIPISMWTNGNFNGTTTIIATLETGESTTFQFPDTILAILGTHDICLKTELLGDVDTINNLNCKTISCFLQGISNPEFEGANVGNLIPNPNHGRTILPFSIANSGNVKVSVFDILGNELLVIEGEMPAGENQLEIITNDMKPGLYMVKFQWESFYYTRRMLIVK